MKDINTCRVWEFELLTYYRDVQPPKLNSSLKLVLVPYTKHIQYLTRWCSFFLSILQLGNWLILLIVKPYVRLKPGMEMHDDRSLWFHVWMYRVYKTYSDKFKFIIPNVSLYQLRLHNQITNYLSWLYNIPQECNLHECNLCRLDNYIDN